MTQTNAGTASASGPAADTQPGAGSGGQDIVVTARRREETLLTVPIAVTAFSADKLARTGAIDLTDIQNVTPNTTLKDARGTNSTLAAFIRGVGQQDPVPGFEAGIGIYLDDVYLNRPQAAVLDIYDVDRIEVLRGPQGTLYGRNTIGGAVKYVTKRLPDRFQVTARAGPMARSTRPTASSASPRRSANCSRSADGGAADPRWLRPQPQSRHRQLQQGCLGRAGHA